ncbi:MAG: hypothetical protein LBJ00_12090 [Planctomycetaceae bacterium]|jgi:hypothetical protein|nr:hypothetical protein [Planctomycetaceae bacterium]
MKLITETQQREAVAQGRSLSPYRLRYIGFDVCEYPDSNKINLLPMDEIFGNNSQVNYFDGEENVQDKWRQIEKKKE